MNNDPFTTAARARAKGQWPMQEERHAFVTGAEWARTHLDAQEPTDETRGRATADPDLGLAKIRGSDVVHIEHKGRRIEVSISPKGGNVRVHVDGEEWKP